MKLKSMLLLAVAIGCGVVAMIGVQQVISGSGDKGGDRSKVLVAMVDIEPGVKLSEANTHFAEWQADRIPESAVTSWEEVEDRSMRIPVVANDIIMLTKMNPKGVHGHSAAVPQGMRVITLKADPKVTHSGLIRPGDRVDLVVTFTVDVDGHRNVKRTKTILEYIEVFATGNVRAADVNPEDASEYDAKNVSLLVTPDQFNLCVQAQQMGSLSFPLRNKGDNAVADAAMADESILNDIEASVGEETKEGMVVESKSPSQDELLAFLRSQAQGQAQAHVEPEPVPEVVVEPKKWTIKVYAGNKVRETKFDIPEEESAAVPATEAGKRETPRKGWLRSLFSGS